MNNDRITGGLGLLAAVSVVIYSFKLEVGIYGHGQLGPGTFPLVAGVALGVCSAALLAKSFKSKSEREKVGAQERKGISRRLVYPVLALFVYGLVFEWLGFILSTFFLVAFLFRIFEPKSWMSIAFKAGAVSIGVYFVFNVLLNSRLPNGILDVFLR